VSRILIVGRNGQVGWELLRSCQVLGEVVGAGHAVLELSEPESMREPLRELRPDVIVNAAAYTAVDRAEREEALATKVNGEAVKVLAEEAARTGALLVHYSTDYVFDGEGDAPSVESRAPAPINAYGRSKLAGERALQESAATWICLRTSWVYAARGRNFLLTMLRLATEREHLRVVSDQVGAPTSARMVADATSKIISQIQARRRTDAGFTPRIYHLTARGATSWHGFASVILERTRELGIVGDIRVRDIEPIGSSDYPTPAVRPRNSRLECSAVERDFGLILPDWQASLELVLNELCWARGE